MCPGGQTQAGRDQRMVRLTFNQPEDGARERKRGDSRCQWELGSKRGSWEGDHAWDCPQTPDELG